MLTEKDYCYYDTCVALYELGLTFEDASQRFERNILTNRYEEIPRPLLYETQKWLREEKDVIIVVCPYTYDIINKTHTWTCEIWFGDNLEYEIHNFKSYEKALSKGIKEAIKILKDEELTKDF